MNIKDDAKKNLKRFLRRKGGFTEIALVTFLITGSFAWGNDTWQNIQMEKSVLNKKTDKLKTEINQIISRNKEIIEKEKTDMEQLLLKADFFGKPLYKRYQIFFTGTYMNNGSKKNRTREEFKETIKAVEDKYGMGTGGMTAENMVIAGNGVITDDTKYFQTIELGANVKAINPDLPSINPNVIVNASTPLVILGTLPGTIDPSMIAIPSISVVAPLTPATPVGVNVSISAPQPVEKIVVSSPTINTPNVPDEKNIEVNVPVLPGGFEPTLIIPPVVPTTPVINLPTIPIINVNARTTGTGDNAWFWKQNGDLGPISQINIESGTISATSGANIYDIAVANYAGHAAYSGNGLGYAVSGSTFPPIITSTATSSVGLYKWVSAPVIRMGQGVTINFRGVSGSSRAILKNDIHANKSYTIDDLKGQAYTTKNQNGSSVTLPSVLLDSEYNFIKNKVYPYNSTNNTTGGTSYIQYGRNEGTWNLSGKNVNGYEADGHNTNKTISIVFHNKGKITALKDSSSIALSAYGPDAGVSQRVLVTANEGEMTLNGTGAAIFLTMRRSNVEEINFLNYGTLLINGGKNVGVLLKGGLENTSTIFMENPLEIYGDENIGVNIQTTSADINPQNSIIKVNIGVNQDGTITNVSKASSSIASGNSSTADITGNIGIYSLDTDTTMKEHKILIGEKTKKNVGVVAKAGTLNIGSGEIKIFGGSENIGLFTYGGDIVTNGIIEISGGESNIAGFAQEGNTITINGNFKIGNIGADIAVIDSISLYSVGNGSKINIANDKLEINLSGDSLGGFADTKGSITANRTTAPTLPTQITVNGKQAYPEPTATTNIKVAGGIDAITNKPFGIGLFANSGGVITTKNNYIKVTDGNTGLVSMGTNSKINVDGGIIDYDGKGYALYASGGGNITLKNGMVILRGSSTALELDQSITSNPIDLTGSKIVVMSNDVIATNLTNLTSALDISTLENDISTLLGGVTIAAGTDGTVVFDKYKIAAVDGGSLNIDVSLDKADTTTSSNGFFYYRRFLGQRLVINVETNIEVKAEIDSSYAAAYFNSQVVGVEMNSSSQAINVNETQINLSSGSKIIANRTDSGNGGIGAFINYGQVTLTTGSSIEVEKVNSLITGDTSSKKGIGIYAVNGSEVNLNTGSSLNIYGDEAVGIVAMAQREDSTGAPIVSEFGVGAVGQGKISIINAGTITLTGTGSVGVYALNNNTSGTKADAIVTNTGTIIVKDSALTSSAVGIYGGKVTIDNQGTIEVGKGGVAIFAKNNSEIQNIGTLKLGEGGIGIMADGTTSITGTSVTVVDTVSGGDSVGKTVIIFEGAASDSQTVSIDINSSSLTKGTGMYIKKMNLTSTGILDIGDQGAGLYVSNGGTAINTGTIKLVKTPGVGSVDAVAMYTKNGTIENSGTINVEDSTSVGMYGEGLTSTVKNSGTINLTIDGSTGIFISDQVTLNFTGGSIVFGTTANSIKSSLGIFAEDSSNINLSGTVTFTNSNENKNILLYVKNSSINNSGVLNIDGITSSTIAGNKTVGIYLENSGNASIYTGVGIAELISVKNEAIGLYSKGVNTLSQISVAADGQKTTGIFLDGGSKIDGVVTANRDAIGIYGTGGKIDIMAGGLTLNTSNGTGTGIYLTDGAYMTAAGNKIIFNNSASVENIGVYYAKGTGSTVVTHGADIELTGNKGIGIYGADGITLTNGNNITSTGTISGNIAVFIGGDSNYTSTGDISLIGANEIGIYVEKGKATTTGNILLTGTPTTTGVGLAVKTTTGESGTIINTGTITTNGNLGMYVAGSGTSTGVNSGTIITTTGTGVYVDGSSNSANIKFDGSGGTITADKLGIYLKDTEAGTVADTGILNITSGGVGIFGENAKIDFAIDSSNSSGEAALVVKGNSQIKDGTINAGSGSVGIFVIDDTVTFDGTNNVSTKVNSSTGTSVGIYLAETLGSGTPYKLNNININSEDGVGVYLGNDITSSTGANIVFDGVITSSASGSATGVGIYAPKHTTLVTGIATINIDGGAGIYVKEGSADVGTNGKVTFNFSTNGGVGIFNNGGNIIIGNDVELIGSGALAATINGSLVSSGDFNIKEGAVGLMGRYDTFLTSAKNLGNSGTITVSDGGIGIAAVDEGTGGLGTGGSVILNNSGTIKVTGVSNTGIPSIGIYTDVGDIVNSGSIEVGSNGIGIYTTYNSVNTSIDNQNMVMKGKEGIGVYIKGTTDGFVFNNISSTGSKNTGIVLEDTGTFTGTLDIGNVALGNESIGLFITQPVTSTATNTITGSIKVGDGSATKSSIGLVVNNGAKITVAGGGNITTGRLGIGAYAEGPGTILTVTDTDDFSVGTDGTYFYTKDATLNINGDIAVDNNIGIVADGGILNLGLGSTITVMNGGMGMYVKNTSPALGGTTINVQGGSLAEYSVGAYYEGVNLTSSGTPIITQNGSYNIGIVLDESSNATVSSPINIGTGTDKNQIGIVAKDSSAIAFNNSITINGGDNNIGIYSENSNVNVTGNIGVDLPVSTIDHDDPMKYSSVGVFLSENSNYTGNGNIILGDYSIGIFGKDLTAGSSIIQNGTTMSIGKGGVGMFGEGSGNSTENLNVSINNIILGSDNSIGIYGRGIETNLNGDITVGSNTSVGIVSEGNGNVTHSGDMTIADKTSSGSIGIYKIDGTGTITTSSGSTWDIGKAGYGIYVKQTTGGSSIINYNGTMNLKEAGIGIYSEGGNLVTNNGIINVGKTKLGADPTNAKTRLNSVGIYVSEGSKGINNGVITVDEQYSLAIYASGVGTTFKNMGTIDISNGGIGVLARNGAIITNETSGIINLSNHSENVAMASYANSEIINKGTINVTNGTGMVVGTGSSLTNAGTINVVDGTGIGGRGIVINTGVINITGTGIANGSGGNNVDVGSVRIAEDGTIIINGNYTSIGGTLQTSGSLIVNGAYVDVTTGTPIFSAETVSGEVEIMGNFATTGNGTTYEIKDFLNTASGIITGTALTPVTSPLFLSKIGNDGSLIIVKRPYSDLTAGDQFKEMEDGLDNLLTSNPYGKDGEALKYLNKYLEDLSTDQFEDEASRSLSEMRGDIYSTIQERIENVNKAFDTSFDELIDSYNTSREVGKFSVMHSRGDYEDDTIGITDYDYTITGLLYMNEFEGNKFGEKSGYTLGFSSSDFDFDDEGSKERIYSLRGGIHKVTRFTKDTKLTSKLGLGYNRHKAERKILLDQMYENDGRYNSYAVSFDNKVSHSLILNLDTRLDIYGALNLEAGKIDDFKEDGTIELDVETNDYFSSKIKVGVEGSKRYYLGKNISLKLSGGANYSYELGENINNNRARISSSDQGYYGLISPEAERGKTTGILGLTIEKGNHTGVTLAYEVSDDESRRKLSEKYSLRFNYKF